MTTSSRRTWAFSALVGLGVLLPTPSAGAAAPALDNPPPDVVEVIPDGPVQAPSPDSNANAASPLPVAPPSAVEPPPTGPLLKAELGKARPESEPTERFQLTGWARQSIELGFSNDALRPGQAERTALPYDRLIERSQLFLAARYSRQRWFEADVSGEISYSAFEQGPSGQSTPFNGFNGQDARGVVEPRLYELFVGFFWSKLDLRIGQQRVAWGKGDFVSPNDVVNARDRRDPFLAESELRHIPTLAVRADVDFGFGSLQAIISPAFTPDRFDVYGSNWAALQPDAPAWVRGLANLLQRPVDRTLQEVEQPLLSATSYPKSDFTHPVLGARWSWAIRGADVSYYYQYGFDGPLIKVDPDLLASLSTLDYSKAGLADLEPLLRDIDAGQAPIQLRYVRRHHIGMDAATTLGPFALRLDAAYDTKSVFVRQDFLGATSPTFQGVASIEYQTGDREKDVLLEGIYQRVFTDQPVPLLIYDRNSVATALNLRWTLVDPVSVDIRALIGFLPRTELVQPQVNIKFNALVLSAGCLLMDGSPFSFGEYFHRNRETYVKAKYAF